MNIFAVLKAVSLVKSVYSVWSEGLFQCSVFAVQGDLDSPFKKYAFKKKGKKKKKTSSFIRTQNPVGRWRFFLIFFLFITFILGVFWLPKGRISFWYVPDSFSPCSILYLFIFLFLRNLPVCSWYHPGKSSGDESSREWLFWFFLLYVSLNSTPSSGLVFPLNSLNEKTVR